MPGVTSQLDLAKLRPEIDSIDDDILALLHRRARLVLEVGEYKRERNMQVYDAERERTLLARLCEAVQPPLDKDAVKRIFERIVDEMRRIEQHHVG
jgi:chorismate mutase